MLFVIYCTVFIKALVFQDLIHNQLRFYYQKLYKNLEKQDEKNKKGNKALLINVRVYGGILNIFIQFKRIENRIKRREIMREMKKCILIFLGLFKIVLN